jgi:hypothetical protein
LNAAEFWYNEVSVETAIAILPLRTGNCHKKGPISEPTWSKRKEEKIGSCDRRMNTAVAEWEHKLPKPTGYPPLNIARTQVS